MLARSLATGIAACPGPPASATTAFSLGAPPPCRRSTESVTAPAAPPFRFSGTVSVVQENPPPCGQGVKASASAVGARPKASASVVRAAAEISFEMARDTRTDVSERGLLYAPNT